MNTAIPRTLAVIASIVLAACGGGGGDSSSSATTTPITAPSPPVGATSYWSMNAYSYVNGGFSAQSTTMLAGRPLTVVAVSTATLVGGDTSNGAYSGSALTFSFVNNGAGTYNVVKDSATLIASATSANPIVVQSNVGVGVTTGGTLYVAASGQVKVTLDSAGKYHFASVEALPTAKTLDVLGGVAGAPATMALVIHDAY